MRKLLILFGSLILLSSCDDPSEPCLELPSTAMIGEEIEVLNCSRNYDEIEINCSAFLNKDTDLPIYNLKFDKAGTFTVNLRTNNGKGNETISEQIVVKGPEASDIIGKWRLYKSESIGEYAFEDLSNAYAYDVFEVKAYDESLRFTDDSLYVVSSFNSDPYFYDYEGVYSFNEGIAETFNRSYLRIGAELYHVVGFFEGRMILYFEEFDLFVKNRELLYLERRN